MVAERIERLNFYQFQYVGAEDFRDQQAYHRDMRRRHNLGPHSWGIVQGCDIIEVPREGDAPFVDIQILPGVVVDGFGREIILLEPVRIDPELFAAFATDRHLELWIGYDELAAQTATGGFAPCTDVDAYSRIIETYRFVVGSRGPVGASDAWRQAVIVGGKPATPAIVPLPPPAPPPVVNPTDPIEPADLSIPYQDFPDVERGALWLIQLGWVHWDGTVRKFRQAASPDKLKEGRRYAGFIGASLLAEGPGLRIAPRTAPADIEAAPFASIEGRLAVDGSIVARKNVNIEGGRLQLLAAGGLDETRPLWLSRLGASIGSGADLRIHIGDTADAKTRLTIGPGPSPTAVATEQVVLAVAGDDKVHIPTGQLLFGNGARALIDLGPDTGANAGQNTIGRHSGSVYQRSQGSHYWHFQGEHDSADGNPGTGGLQQLELTANGTLKFCDRFRHLVEADITGQGFGVGVQDRTLYMRSNRNFAWYRGGGHDSNQLDPGGGAVAMILDNSSRLAVRGGVTSQGDLQLWGTRLQFLLDDGTTDTDPMEIVRVRNASDRNDLRVTIGDNLGGDDRFVVGPLPGDGVFREQFIVENAGDVRIAGNLWVQGRKALVDVVAGEVFLNRTSNGSGTLAIPVTTRMSRFSTLQFMVALSDIGNVSTAVGARWRVANAGFTALDADTAEIRIDWRVDDIDGQLFSFSYLVIFLP